jgi:hypothetical protein
MQCFQNALAYFAAAVSYDCKIFMKPSPGAAEGQAPCCCGVAFQLDRFNHVQSCSIMFNHVQHVSMTFYFVMDTQQKYATLQSMYNLV